MLTLERLGKYEIVEQIGEGGFGTVWSGRDPLLKRTVAIKTCESEDEELRQRFLREAEIAASLHHPNIVVVHDFGYEGGIPYLVEEFLTGEDLSKIIARRESVPLPTKLRWLADVCRGLDFAHTHGVIHRDVKPGNVRILDDGSAKVLDFGIAKLAEADTQHLTKTGTAIGTVGYMAPEQLSGDPVDFRSDVFSFGVVAYELLSYARPFEGETVSRVFFKLLNEDPPTLTSIAEDVPPDLERIVLRCLAKSPDRRYGSAQTILDDLERVAAGEPLDLDSTGEVTTDLGRLPAPAPGVAPGRAPSPASAVAPTLLVRPSARRPARSGFVVAGVLALIFAGAIWLPHALAPRLEAPDAARPPVDTADSSDPAFEASGAGGETEASELGAPRVPVRRSLAQAPSPGNQPSSARQTAPAEPTTSPETTPGAPTEKPEGLSAGAPGLEIAQVEPGVVLPRIVERPPLRYPPLARRMRQEGVVSVAVRVDENGSVTDVRPLGDEVGFGLDEATADYARECRWEPGTRDGKPAPMWYELQVRYSLQRR